MIDAQRVLLDFELLYERARAETAIQAGRLEMLTGCTLIDADAKPAN